MTVELKDIAPILAALDYVAVSPIGRDLCTSLGAGLAVHEQNTGDRIYRRGDSGQEKLVRAIGAFLADLLSAAGNIESGGWVYRAMRTSAFSGARVGIKIFRRVLTAMVTLGFVEAHEDNEIKGPTKARASHWRATKRLLKLAEGKGVTPDNVHDHFQQGLPACPVVLRAASERRGRHKVRGERIIFAATPQTIALENDVRRLNEFLDGFEITGGNHRGYTRVFNNGFTQGYGWNQGGRLFSLCRDSYQNMESKLRPLMTIGREPVVEIDVRASYLTVLHGITGKPFDPSQDAYDLEGLLPMPLSKDVTRGVVKQWTVVSLGQGQHLKRWPDEVIEEFKHDTGCKLGATYPIREVRQAMETKHPVLKDWGQMGLSWADLMFHESKAMLNTMLELMDHSIPSLTVHDSLIVRRRDADDALRALRNNYMTACGIDPHLTTKGMPIS